MALRRNRTARQSHFDTVPSQHIQRSKFSMPQTRKQAFNASEIVPVMVEEVLPGDTWLHTEHYSARLATPIAPVQDDLYMDTYYFFVPNRITGGEQWENFITGSDTDVNQTIIPGEAGSCAIVAGGVLDHMGMPPGAYTADLHVTVYPIWAYFDIYDEWFRDQNLQAAWDWPTTWTNTEGTTDITNGTPWDQLPLRACKRHDYFTASLPWPQKGAAVQLPLGSTAPIIADGTNPIGLKDLTTNDDRPMYVYGPGAGLPYTLAFGTLQGAMAGHQVGLDSAASGMVADLSAATGATLNAMRLAITTQQLLELDARGGSRYVENILAHWGVRAPDYRLNRPEYLGGSSTMITTNPIAQTAAYNVDTGTVESALGNLGAEMHASSSKRTFTYAATEHGYIIGLGVVRAQPTYQQGFRRHWLHRNTRLDYPDPIFANIGEQAVHTDEIYMPADTTPATPTWGYQERYAEMRVIPNEVTGVLRSTSATPMDWWHYAEEFDNEPALNDEFILDKTQETLARSLATAPNEQWSAQIILDIKHDNIVARALPAYGVPGLTRF